MDAEELFLQNVATIDRIAMHVARRNGLRQHDDLAEFAAEAKFRLIENDYGIIRKFEGRSLFSTFLDTVIGRLFYERRVAEWGKWRPSAEAKRLGLRAVALEQLITRDGHTFAEAAQILLSRTGAGYTLAELQAIWSRLPARQPRPKMVAEENSIETPAATSADGPLLAREREQMAGVASGVIDRTISALPPEDQLILRLRFWEALKVSAIAARLCLDQKKLYKRLEKLFGTLRRALADAGVQQDDVASLLDAGDSEIAVDISSVAAKSRGNPVTKPSHLTKRERGAGRRRRS